MAETALPAQAALEPAAATDAVIATGAVTQDGVPLENVEVEARVWPNPEELEKVPAGSFADVRSAGVVRTDAQGRYLIRVNSAAVPETHKDEDGNVSVELSATYKGQVIPWSYTATLQGESNDKNWSTKSADLAGQAKPGEFRFNFGATPSVLDVNDPPSEWVDESDTPLSASRTSAAKRMLTSDGAMSVTPRAGRCEKATNTYYRNKREHFLNVYSWAGAKATVEQAISASSGHTLGLAYKPEGGNWSVSGTNTMSVTRGYGQRVPNVVDARIYNAVNYRKWECYWIGGALMGTEVRPHNFYDVFNEPYTYAGHYNFNQGCVAKSPSTTVWKSTGKAVTQSSGVTLGFVSVSAQSGYDNGSKVAFAITSNSWLCGNSNQGWPNATQVDARRR